MAIITILFGCVIGAMAGLVQLTFLGASFGLAFLTYVSVSMLLPAMVLITAAAVKHMSGTETDDAEISRSNLEAWQDWQIEEEMETDSLIAAIESDERAVRRTA